MRIGGREPSAGRAKIIPDFFPKIFGPPGAVALENNGLATKAQRAQRTASSWFSPLCSLCLCGWIIFRKSQKGDLYPVKYPRFAYRS
jgi:hypothetical protein